MQYDVTHTSGLENNLTISPRQVSLMMTAIGTGTQTATITVTQTQASGTVSVDSSLHYTVHDTQIFNSLNLNPASKWVEESDGSMINLNAAGGLNDLISANVDSVDSNGMPLAIDYAVSSTPPSMFTVSYVVATGKPQLHWEANAKVPSYEVTNQVEIELTATPDGRTPGETMLMTVGVEDIHDPLDVAVCTPTSPMGTVDLVQGNRTTVTYTLGCGSG